EEPCAQTQGDRVIEDQFDCADDEHDDRVAQIGNPAPERDVHGKLVPNGNHHPKVDKDEQPAHHSELLIASAHDQGYIGQCHALHSSKLSTPRTTANSG